MRSRLLAALLATAVSLTAAPSIVRVWGDYVPAESFERIGEYFGAPESHPGRAVVRTQPDNRSGYYFLVRIKDSDTIPAGARWQVQVLRANERKASAYEFAITGHASVYQLGLTGSDWTNPKDVPVAWKVTLLAADGSTVLSHHSFLWE